MDVLSEKTSTTENSKTLWIATARMLRVSFEHDQDGENLLRRPFAFAY